MSRRLKRIEETLARLEDRVDAIHFQLFEERTGRTAAEGYFDERRHDRDYDDAYRKAWRTLRDTAPEG